MSNKILLRLWCISTRERERERKGGPMLKLSNQTSFVKCLFNIHKSLVCSRQIQLRPLKTHHQTVMIINTLEWAENLSVSESSPLMGWSSRERVHRRRRSRVRIVLGLRRERRLEERVGQIVMVRRSEEARRRRRRRGHLQLVARRVINGGQLQVRVQIADRASADQGILSYTGTFTTNSFRLDSTCAPRHRATHRHASHRHQRPSE